MAVDAVARGLAAYANSADGISAAGGALFVGQADMAAVNRALANASVQPILVTPTGGTFYVSGSGATSLPAGSDGAAGTEAAPFATLTYALSQVPSAGNYLILCEGTFAENNSGRWILAKSAALPVLIDSYTGSADDFIITNASGTNGVVNVRSSSVANIQIRRATIQSATEGNSLFRHDPTSAAQAARNVSFFECVFKQKTHSSAVSAIILRGDNGISGFKLVNCQFQRVAGSSTSAEPKIIETSAYTSTVNNQPHRNITVYGCSTTDDQWSDFATDLSGVDGIGIYKNSFQVNSGHSLLLATDSSDATRPKVTGVEVALNSLSATGSNPHVVVLGANVTNPVFAGNIGYSEGQGYVMKGSINAIVFGGELYCVGTGAVSGSALYAKASTGTKFLQVKVTVDGTADPVTAFRDGEDGSNKSSDTVLKDCQIEARGANATLLFWGGSSSSNGGGVSDYNRYALAASAALGSVRGQSVSSLADIQAAWVSDGLPGDVATNDANSSLASVA
jgi:hypothetical protein